MHLNTDKEKELWRQAAVAALKSVEDVKTTDSKPALQHAALVADGIVRKYRERCEG